MPLPPRRSRIEADLDLLSEVLGELLDAMSVYEALGLMTAVHTMPTVVPPSRWLPEVIGEPELETRDDATEAIGAVMIAYNCVGVALERHRPIIPPLDDAAALESYCAGYLRGVRMDDLWIEDEEAAASLGLFRVLAGELHLSLDDDDEHDERDHASEGDPTERGVAGRSGIHEEQLREHMPRFVLMLHEHFGEARRLDSAEGVAPGGPSQCTMSVRQREEVQTLLRSRRVTRRAHELAGVGDAAGQSDTPYADPRMPRHDAEGGPT